MKKDDKVISPIAYIKTDFHDKFGVPRQSMRVESLVGEIVFLPEYSCKEAFRGIEEYSHLWLIFSFSKAEYKSFSPTVRPPRLGGNKRVGVFATRSPFRPNTLGLSSVKLLGVEKRDNTFVLKVAGADLVDNTPIYDVKPYLPYTDAHVDAQGSFAEENADHRLEVEFSPDLLALVPEDKRTSLIDCLADDPRPAYKEEGDRVYTMSFAGLDVSFTVREKTLFVTSVKRL